MNQFVATAHLRKDKQTGRFLSANTKKQYVTSVRHLKEFAEICKKEDFEFNEIRLLWNYFLNLKP